MTAEALEQLREQAMHLSELERAALARDLIRSLDAPFDEGVEQAWDAEIAQRVAQIETGEAQLISRDDFRMLARKRIESQG